MPRDGPPCVCCVWQAAAARFAEEFEALLQQIEADPAAEVAGRGSEPLSCVRLCALRCAGRPHLPEFAAPGPLLTCNI